MSIDGKMRVLCCFNLAREFCSQMRTPFVLRKWYFGAIGLYFLLWQNPLRG